MLIKIEDARVILIAENHQGERIELYETEEQFICIENHRFVAVCANFDFDYRPLAETLEEQIGRILYASWDAAGIVEDWLEVDCPCIGLFKKIKAYFDQFGKEE